MTTAPIKVERGGPTGWITLNRPEAMNAVNDEVRHALPKALAELEDDAQIRVIVIRAAGARAFSVGADVKEERAAETPSETRERLTRFAWIEAVASACKPTIASVQGFCLGGGLELALACDIRIAAPDATFALPEINMGLLPGGGGTQRLPRLIGLGRAIDMMLTGERINADRALDFGLITRVAASAEVLIDETNKLAASIAEKPPQAARLIKEAAMRGLDLPLNDALRLERMLFTLLFSTDDRLEASAAFKEKRRAKFAGR